MNEFMDDFCFVLFVWVDIFIVEDELKLVELLQKYLVVVGYILCYVVCGDVVLDVVCVQWLDLILLDIMLLGMDGWEICCQLCIFLDVLVLMLMVCVEEEDCLCGLELGVDDYIGKILFLLCEIVVWVKFMFRCNVLVQCLVLVDIQLQSSLLLVIDEICYQVSVCGELFNLMLLELCLFKMFVVVLGQVFLWEQLFNYLYDDDCLVIDCVIDIYIKNLCCKFEFCFFGYNVIQVVYGVGYCFVLLLE